MGAGAACATTALGVSLYRSAPALAPDDTTTVELALARQLLRVLPAPHRLRTLGQVQLAQTGRPRTVGSLLRRLLPTSARLGGIADAELRRALRSRVASDYEEGRLVSLSGWLLSETEALACALAVLLDRE